MSELRSWRDVRKENFTTDEVEKAYAEIVDEMKASLQRANEVIRLAEEALSWYADDTNAAHCDGNSEVCGTNGSIKAQEALAAIATYKQGDGGE